MVISVSKPQEKKLPSSSIQDDNSYEIIVFLPIILLFLWQYDEGVVGKRISFGINQTNISLEYGLLDYLAYERAR